MSKTVISHLLQRLKEIGITDIFGVPGDYAFPVNDAICNDQELNWIGCCNELNASFAADGYARIKGCSALCTTYGVGELNALGGIAGAYAEHLPIFHIVGMPKHSILEGNNIMHHTLGNGEFDLFHKMVQPVVCASSILTPENSVSEIERLINAALTQKMPVYIGIPADFALMEIGCSKPHPISKQTSDAETLATVVQVIIDKIDNALSPVAVVGTLIGRYDLRSETQQIIEKAGLPFTSMFMGKGTLSESHPNFIGVYCGNLLAEDVCEIVEDSDLVISFGTIRSDINTGAFTIKINPIGEINIHPDHVHVGRATYENVLIQDVITALGKKIKVRKIKEKHQVQGLGNPQGAATAEITPESLYPRIEKFFRTGDIIMAETGTASMGLVTAKLPDEATFYNQTLWGSIGWATPAAFGAAVAAPDRRVILITGEGAHQLTVQEISQFGRFGLKPVILCLNNDGYLIERMLCEDPYIYYNDLAQWNYSKLPDAFGMTDWFAAKVVNNQQLDESLDIATKADSGSYIEIVTDKMAASEMALALNRIVVNGKGWKE
ncbi:alpha-keto acid decarboxylase family protein [Maridesulfovibrio ferrireducens]|uniref:alpha-keto acid decarboxylase family protein n=1 Tax=Maridesulfovibrio ferrireducens TaxID=246191 RepID=UPI001A22BE16|nr:thiamine pyrophosphate-binding protein [Maridesulfovibrio ferrireducens]MBI9111054.1 alpha-keto acid decarboxylase family protein [Maridesulfovibrio ferrireducens]